MGGSDPERRASREVGAAGLWRVAALALAGGAFAAMALACAGSGGSGRGAGTGGPATLRLGHFPNLTHAQALMARRDGTYERAVGGPIEWTSFNAGPSAVEALFAGAVDAVYVGPNPAINGHIKSHGQSFVVVAGAASGGAALVVRPSAGISTDRDFHGRTVATPQLGNTQDVAARLWFESRGYTLRERGGDLTILPLANPDQLQLMKRGEIDAAWTIEPWVSRLEQEAGAGVFLDEKSLWPGGRYPTALLVVSRSFLAAHADTVSRLIAAHVDQTSRLRQSSDSLVAALGDEIGRLTSKPLPASVIRSALARIEFTWDPMTAALARCAEDAHRVGFLRETPNLDGLVDRRLLDAVLSARGLSAAEAPR